MELQIQRASRSENRSKTLRWVGLTDAEVDNSGPAVRTSQRFPAPDVASNFWNALLCRPGVRHPLLRIRNCNHLVG